MSNKHKYSEYRSDIDGLRAIAVLSVVVFHVFPSWIKGGFIGVDVFFVISGFLISTIIFRNLEMGTFSFCEFYSRRIRRIFPSLLLVLAISCALGWFALLADEYKQLGKHVAGGAGFVSNLILWKEAGYFDNGSETKPLLHLWSLGIEEQFYIIYPLILWLTWRKKINLLFSLLVVALISFLLNIQGIKSDITGTFYSPLTRFWELMLGGILAWGILYKSKWYPSFAQLVNIALLQNIRVFSFSPGAIRNGASWLGLVLLVYGFFRIGKGFNFPGTWALIPVFGALLLIAAGRDAWINKKILSNRILVWFGLISFPLYLWHWLLLSFVRVVESKTPSIGIRVTCVGLAICLAWITYKYIERPFRYGHYSKSKTFILVSLSIIVGLMGLVIFNQEGYEKRESINGFINNKNELIRTPAKNNECIQYLAPIAPLFPYCKFKDNGATETVAVIGDSHAHVAYPGVAEFFKNRNTVLFANSGCPSLLGYAMTGSTQEERKLCDEQTSQLLNILKNKADIKVVLFFSRGPIYITHTEPLSDEKILEGPRNNYVDYQRGLQKTIDELKKSEKKVFYITENPELSYGVESCIERPYRFSSVDCQPLRKDVLSRQKDYLEAISTLQNVQLINSLEAFCPAEKCLTYYEGKLLYADDDHLSVAGSSFQFEKLLRKYFE